MQETVLRLQEDLERIRTMPVFLAINYIRKAMGYDNYLREKPENGDGGALLTEAALIQDSARGCPSLSRWREVIEERKRSELGERGEENPEAGVTFSTMHGSKGLEYDKVFLIQCNEEVTPHKKARTEAELEEERRMFYVGITRAKKELRLFYVGEQEGRTKKEGPGTKPILPSRFLRELQ